MAITDLTGTKWYFNESINLQGEYGEFAYNINYFIGNLPDEKTQLISEPNAFGSALWTNDDVLLYAFETGWRDESFRNIHITGGDDATNPVIAQWLQDNAISVENTPFKMYPNGKNLNSIIIKQNDVATFITKAYLGSNPNPVFETEELHELGGRIFYVDTTATGATYKFYDSEFRELVNQSVVGLASAKYYTVSGTPVKDKFYILATDPNNDNHAVVHGAVQWGAYGTDVIIDIADGIGQGKINTTIALETPECFVDSPKGTRSTGSNTIWTWLKAQRDNNLNGYNDWFIPSFAELKKLQSSGIEKDYIINTLGYDYQFLWSSVEDNNDNAYRVPWPSGDSLLYDSKYMDFYYDDVWGCVAARSI